MARATRRRRRISFNKDVICCGELVMVVDKKVVYSFKMCDHIKVMCVSGRQHCGWQGQHAEETMDSGHYDVSLKLELLVFYSSLLASLSSFSTLMIS
jgi:hypothetical protein